MSPRSAPLVSVAILPQSRGGACGRLAATALVWLAAAVAGPVLAQDRPAVPTAGDASGPCVEIDIGGWRTGALECVNQRLRDARIDARAASGGVEPARTLNARSADHRLGLTNQAAFRQRMGAAYGVSIRPERPGAVYRPVLPVSPSSPH